MANLKFLKRVGYSDINTLQDDDSAIIIPGSQKKATQMVVIMLAIPTTSRDWIT